MKLLLTCLLVSFVLLSSCKDKTPEDCSCASKHYTPIENVRVSYAHGIISTFADDNRLVNSYKLCTPLDTLAESKDMLVPDYIMSGQMKLPCFFGPTLVTSPPLLKVTEIRKIN